MPTFRLLDKNGRYRRSERASSPDKVKLPAGWTIEGHEPAPVEKAPAFGRWQVVTFPKHPDMFRQTEYAFVISCVEDTARVQWPDYTTSWEKVSEARPVSDEVSCLVREVAHLRVELAKVQARLAARSF